MLDYGHAGNRACDIARILRHYLVRVDPGPDDLLLGQAYFAAPGWPAASS